jgi:hypothetical protein
MLLLCLFLVLPNIRGLYMFRTLGRCFFFEQSFRLIVCIEINVVWLLLFFYVFSLDFFHYIVAVVRLGRHIGDHSSVWSEIQTLCFANNSTSRCSLLSIPAYSCKSYHTWQWSLLDPFCSLFILMISITNFLNRNSIFSLTIR